MWISIAEVPSRMMRGMPHTLRARVALAALGAAVLLAGGRIDGLGTLSAEPSDVSRSFVALAWAAVPLPPWPPAPARQTWTLLPYSAKTPRWSVAARKSSTSARI